MGIVRWEEGKHPRGTNGRFITLGAHAQIDGGKGGHGRVVKIDPKTKTVTVATTDGHKAVAPSRVNVSKAPHALKAKPLTKVQRTGSKGNPAVVEVKSSDVTHVAPASRDEFKNAADAFLTSKNVKKGEHFGVAADKKKASRKLAFYRAGAALAIAASVAGGSSGEAGGQNVMHLEGHEGQTGSEVESRLPPDVETLRSFSSKSGSDEDRESANRFKMVIPSRSLLI